MVAKKVRDVFLGFRLKFSDQRLAGALFFSFFAHHGLVGYYYAFYGVVWVFVGSPNEVGKFYSLTVGISCTCELQYVKKL